MSPPGPTIAGRYELKGSIANGGMAEVFLAVQHGPAGFRKLVAMKEPHAHLLQQPEFLGMFLDEAKLAATLSHSHLGQVFELCFEEGRYFLVMEYLGGPTLRQVLRKEGLRPELGAWLVARIADGLAYVHGRTNPEGAPLGLIHRDVTPENVLLTFDGQVKLVDFGIARAAASPRRTRTGAVRGKTAYMSPEQIRGEALDARSDVFALGALLYEVLAGAPPFAGESDYALMQAVLSHQAPALGEGLGAALWPLISEALHKDKERRTTSARLFARHIDEALHALRLDGVLLLQEHLERSFATEHEAERARVREALASAAPSLTRSPARSASTATLERLGGPPAGRRPTWVWAVAAATLAGIVAGGLGWSAGASRPRGPERPPSPARPASPQAPAMESATAIAGIHAGSLQNTPMQPATAAQLPSGEGPGKGPSASTARPTRSQRPQTTRRAQASSSSTPPLPASSDTDATRHSSPALAHGRLTFDSEPWTEVYVGARRLGTTPLVELSLPAGHHRLRAVNRAAGIDAYVDVEVAAGQLTRKKSVW